MTNNFKVIFDPSDLHIQENLNPKNLKIVFGYEDTKPPVSNCDPAWVEVDGDKVDIDCSCSKPWIEVDGDGVDLECPKPPNKCDPKWKDDNSTDFNCGCATPWTDSSNDFNIDCSTEPTTSDLGVVRAYQGEYVTYSIYGLEIYKAYDGQEVSVDFDIRQTLLGEFRYPSGETVDTDISNSRFLAPKVEHGEYTFIDIKYSPIAYLEPKSDVGETVDTILNTDSVIEVEYSTGEEVNHELSTYPAISFDVSVYDGQLLNSRLDTISGFIPLVYDGHNIDIDLFTPDIGRIDVFIEEGQEVKTDLSIINSFNANIYDGQATELTMSTYYEWQVFIEHNEERVDFEFYEPSTFMIEMKVYEGQSSKTEINTLTGFVIDIYQGEEANINIEFDPYKGYPIEMYSGEESVFQLNNIQEITDLNSICGETVVTDLTTYESFRMEVEVYDGHTTSVTPMFTVIFGEFNSYTGEKLAIELDELDNYRSMMGETASFEMASDSLFEVDSYEGQESDVTMKFGEPVILGTVEVSEGQIMIPDVTIMVSTKFRVSARFGNVMYNDQWTNDPYSIDLDKRKCCTNFFDNLLDIELDDAPYNWTRYDYTIPLCELMTFELSTRRAMTFNAYEGQTMTYDNNFNAFEVRVYEGQTAYSRDVVTEHYIDLEEGNLIPDGEITIEIDRPKIPNDVKLLRMYSGESIFFKFGVPYAVHSNLRFGGETVDIELIINPSLKPRIYHGEEVKTVVNTNVQVPFSVNFGNTSDFKIYEPPYEAFDGQYVEFELDTKNDYYAEFVSSGCLDNQYTDIGENGQPIPPEFGGANVEGEKFLNYIEGRCF